LLAINRQLIRKNNKSRTFVNKRLRRRRSNKQENNIKLKRKKRSSLRYSCKEREEICKLRVLSFELIIIINFFDLLVVTFITCY